MNIQTVEIDMKDGTCLRYREYQSPEGVSIAWTERSPNPHEGGVDLLPALVMTTNIFFYHLTGGIA